MSEVYLMTDNIDLLPLKASKGAAAYDIRTPEKITLHDNKPRVISINTGLRFDMPDNMCGLLLPRSSLHMYGLSLANGVGLIDSDYRGEIIVKLRYDGGEPLQEERVIEAGTRIAQLIFLEVPHTYITLTKTLSTTDRGSGGFGSTGNN